MPRRPCGDRQTLREVLCPWRPARVRQRCRAFAAVLRPSRGAARQRGFRTIHPSNLLLSFFDAQIEAQYTVLVAHRHDGNAASHADFRLDHLLLGRLRQVSDVGEGDVVFDLLLDRAPGSEPVVGPATSLLALLPPPPATD